MSQTNPSICIPRAFPNISPKKVKETFEKVFEESCVERVDFIERQDKEKKVFRRFFVHFKYWPKNNISQKVHDTLSQGESIKIVYQEPWYWKCSASRIPKPDNQHTRLMHPRGPYLIEEEIATKESRSSST
jgi:hypothetical protein